MYMMWNEKVYQFSQLIRVSNSIKISVHVLPKLDYLPDLYLIITTDLYLVTCLLMDTATSTKEQVLKMSDTQLQYSKPSKDVTFHASLDQRSIVVMPSTQKLKGKGLCVALLFAIVAKVNLNHLCHTLISLLGVWHK